MRNRLRGMRAYLCGPMDRCPEGGVVWRDKLIPFLSERGIIPLNPCDKPIDVGHEGMDARIRRRQLKQAGRFKEVSIEMREISNVDLHLVDISDFLVVNMDEEIFPAGTCHEIVLGNLLKKPVILRMEQGKVNIPDWWFGRLPHELFFDTWNEVREYIRHVDEDEVVKTYNRWYFFNELMHDLTKNAVLTQNLEFSG